MLAAAARVPNKQGASDFPTEAEASGTGASTGCAGGGGAGLTGGRVTERAIIDGGCFDGTTGSCEPGAFGRRECGNEVGGDDKDEDDCGNKTGGSADCGG